MRIKETKTIQRGSITFALFDIGYTLIMLHNLLVAFSTIHIPVSVQAGMLAAALISLIAYMYKVRFLKASAVIKTLLIIGVGFLVWRASGKMDVLYFSALLFFSQFVDEKDYLRIDIRNRIVLICVLLFLSKFGFITDAVFDKKSLGVTVSQAYGGGFNNPNSLGMMFFLILVEALILMPNVKTGVLRAVGAFVFLLACALFLSGTRTAAILIFVAIVMYILYRKGFFYAGIWNRYGHLVVVVLAVVSFVLVRCYNNGDRFAIVLNSILTGRLSLFSGFIKTYPVSLWGNTVTYYSSSAARALGIPAVVCDNVYIYLLHNLGAVAFFGWITLMLLTGRYMLRNKYHLEYLMLCIVFLYGFMENTMANVMFFPFVVYSSKALFHKEGDGNDLKK